MKLKSKLEKAAVFVLDFCVKAVCKKPKIASKEETVRKIVEERCSIARFGDGDLGLMFGLPEGYQKCDDRLTARLKEVFAIDMDIMRSCSYMLDSADDFDQFFRRLVEGDDPLRKKREEIMRLTNQYTDGNSTQRVVDWLETLLPCGTGK